MTRALILFLIFVSSTAYSGTPGVFIRGDVDNDDDVDNTDVVYLKDYIDGGSFVPYSLDAADVNDDGAINTTDWYQLSYYVASSTNPPPAAPFPNLGVDTTGDYFDNDVSPVPGQNSPFSLSLSLDESTCCEETDDVCVGSDEWDTATRS
jgi:hypothetical protein